MDIYPVQDRRGGAAYYVAEQTTSKGRLMIAEGATHADAFNALLALYSRVLLQHHEKTMQEVRSNE